jgi:isoquinoline 1-oxidoreductase alpha subunit
MNQFTVNGQAAQFEGDPATPLLWVIRDHVGLKGTKYGCGIGQCGACTVHLDGKSVRSCITPVNAAEGKSLTTIEGLAPSGDQLHPVQIAWLELDVPQCGFCQAGQIMAAADLLSRNPDPDDDEIDAHMSNICRCGTYVRLRQAIHRASQLRAAESNEADS